jgi:flagellar protein FliO/FliZ
LKEALMSSIVWWVVVLAILAALAAAGAVLFKAFRDGTSPSAVLFKPKPEPRVEVVEYANIDGKRRLLLIRRDDVEHLIMTGGPVDVVIETGIGEPPKREATPAMGPTMANVMERVAPHIADRMAEQAKPVAAFSRPPRTLAAAPPPLTPAAAAAAEDEADLALTR